MKKIIAMLLILVMLLPLAACGKAEPADVIPAAVPLVREPDEEEYRAWAEENGYVLNPEENGYILRPEEIATSATEEMTGFNFGAIEWSDELRKAAIRDFLKGGTTVADPVYAQDITGYNYRNMMQLATSFNDYPSSINLEMVLDIDRLTLIGISEAGISGTLQFAANPNVSVSWIRQLDDTEREAGYDYFSSYGLSFYGTAKVFGEQDFQTEDGQNELIRIFDTYADTERSFWASYSASFAGIAADNDIRNCKLDYIYEMMSGGQLTVYEIFPKRVVITAPFFLLLAPQYTNALKYTTPQAYGNKYAYTLGISNEFFDLAAQYKNEYLSVEANAKAVEQYYSSAVFTELDAVCQQFGLPSHLEMCIADNNCAGLKTQTTYIPEENS